ncbi:MAG: hypothetical protein HY698_04205 [Deltaproteobacteria bacterium]|nr:hypothetical protein [Deltaproteobacteria bacterium]
MSRIWRRRFAGLCTSSVVVGALAQVACIEPFDGSKIELLIQQGARLPKEGTSPGCPTGTTHEADPPNYCQPPKGQPPARTHYEMYVVRDNFAFHLVNFEIVPSLRVEDPCFVEDEEARIPFTRNSSAAGLHSSKWYDKLLEIYTSDKDGEKGATVTDNEAGALADARRRTENLKKLQDNVQAIVATPYVRGGQSGDPRVELAKLVADKVIPAASLTDEASNKERLEQCRAFFKKYPLYYVGTDRLISLPINGIYYGVVDGTDPRNSGFIGGASVDVDVKMPEFDLLMITWQWNDPNDKRQEAYGKPLENGHYYMAGAPLRRTRGVINVPMANYLFPNDISGEAAIFTELDEDSVHF